jgi:aspartyl-tRNA(Asn)/glutamyl-tRNA(Gln) amidotransferase subunit A
MMATDDLGFTPATELAASIRAKTLSPVEVVDAVLARIDRLNPALNAFCTLTHEGARAAAKQAEAAVMRGGALGLLHGVPVSVKDLVMTKGIRTTWGSKMFEQFVPDEDAPVVVRLKQAGAIVLGKTNTPEFGFKGVTDNPVFGPTRNPWSLAHTPGGSSGGGAAAVAAGLGPLAVGTDGGGSIRIPCSCCGLIGLKPTLGRVAAAPTYGGLETLAHTGPMARTVRDAALMMNAIAGPDARDLGSLPADGTDYVTDLARPVQGLRLGWTSDWGYAPVDPEVRRIAEAAAMRFAEAGCRVEEARPVFESPETPFHVLFTGSIAARLGEKLAEWRGRMDPGLVWMIEEGMKWSAVDYVNAANRRRTLSDAFVKFFAQHDLLLTPTLAAPPLPIGVNHYEEIGGRRVSPSGWFAFTYPINMTGFPAASVPCGWTADGLPVGLQIIGPRFADALVLRAAAAFETIAPWAAKRPPIG